MQIAEGAELSTAACVACDERKAALGNSGATTFTLCSHVQCGQQAQAGLLGRNVTQTRMRPARVVPVKVVSDVGSGRADAVVGLQVRALDGHVVSPGAAPVHTELTAPGQHDAGELLGRELAVLTGVDDLGRAKSRKDLLDDLPGIAGLQCDCGWPRPPPR